MIDPWSVVGAIAAVLAAWLVVVQLVYQKRREDTHAVREGLDQLFRLSELARARLRGAPDPEAALRLAWELHLHLSVEMAHRSKAVQADLLEFWNALDPIICTAVGGDPMEWRALDKLEQAETQRLLEALRALTWTESLRELGAFRGGLQLPGFRDRRPNRAPRIEPSVGPK